MSDRSLIGTDKLYWQLLALEAVIKEEHRQAGSLIAETDQDDASIFGAIPGVKSVDIRKRVEDVYDGPVGLPPPPVERVTKKPNHKDRRQ